mmetsp:Transcript_16654/g.48375  ORF Transcript_16654/g.48375 Transcript_16654/m.48375 type:complete len:263 (-) Transcript_16654:139-927(-)
MSDEDTFTVEQILKKRTRRGREEFLIKWLCYPSSHNTWEPRENILDDRLIQHFELKEAARLASSKRQRVTGTGRAAPVADAPDSAKPAMQCAELRQHDEPVCMIHLRQALAPPEPRAVSPGQLLTAAREALVCGPLIVKNRSPLEDVREYLDHPEVRPRTYVWAIDVLPGAASAADGADGASAEDEDDVRERFTSWKIDLVRRERAAVVELPHEGPIDSHMYIVPPKCSVWQLLCDAGARLDVDSAAIVLVCKAPAPGEAGA